MILFNLGSVQIYLWHTGGACHLRQLLVSGQRTVAKIEEQIIEKPPNEAERVSTGVHVGVQADA